MRYLLKIFKRTILVLLLIFIIWVIVGITYGIYFYGKIGDGFRYTDANIMSRSIHYRQNQNDNQVVFIIKRNVLNYDYNDKYFIITELLYHDYLCQNKRKGHSIYKGFSKGEIYYWLVDKKNLIAYKSLDKSKIENLLKEKNINLVFEKPRAIDLKYYEKLYSTFPFDKCKKMPDDAKRVFKKIIEL